MALSPVARENFILQSMSAMAGGSIAQDQLYDQTRRVFGDTTDEVLSKLIYDFAVALADRYDIENP